jgi:cysteine desulfurase
VLLAAQNFASKTVNVNNKGIINLTDLKAKISDKTVLVSVMLANNEVGSVQPIKEIASIINDIRQYRRQNGINLPIYLHTDACQAVNYLDINVARLGVDLMTINSAKIYGPKQVGALYIRAGVTVVPLVSSGGQEHGLRGGTENVAGTVGFATALIKATKLQKSEATRLAAVRDDFIKIILQGNIGATLNGPVGNRRLANNVHFTFAGIDNEYLLMQLDELGFQVAVGSACGASSGEPSHVLGAMGLGGEVARASLRVTFGKYTSGPMAAKLAQTIIGLVTAQ